MKHKIILYNGFNEFSADSFSLSMRLLANGHPVKEEVFSSGFLKITIKMWIEFDTEDEAAIFKLTYL